MQVFVVFGGSVVLVADLPKLQKSNVLCFLIIGPDFVFCDEEMWSSRSLWHLPDILTRNWYDAEIEIGFYDNSKLWPWSFGIENSKFCSLILVDLTRAKTIAKALDRGLLERNGRKLDMERKVQRSSWFLTLTRFCLQDSKPHVYVHKKMIYISWIRIASVTGWLDDTNYPKKNDIFQLALWQVIRAGNFTQARFLFFLCKTPSHWKQLAMKPNHGALTWRIPPHRISWRNWWRRCAGWTTLAEAV